MDDDTEPRRRAGRRLWLGSGSARALRISLSFYFRPYLALSLSLFLSFFLYLSMSLVCSVLSGPLQMGVKGHNGFS